MIFSIIAAWRLSLVVFFCIIFILFFTDVHLQICGSVKTGFALKGSDTNIRIIIPKTGNPAHVMMEILKVVREHGEFSVVLF